MTSTTEPRQRSTTLMAYGIASYATEIAHLRVLAEAQIPFANRLLQTASTGLGYLIRTQRQRMGGVELSDEEVIGWARQWCTDHVEEVDEIAKKERQGA